MVEEATHNLNMIRELFKDCSEEERSYAEMWAKLLEYPAPNFRRAAIDIEVFSSIATRMPNPDEAEGQVIAVSVYSSDGEKRVLVLKRDGMREGIRASQKILKWNIARQRRSCSKKPLRFFGIIRSF